MSTTLSLDAHLAAIARSTVRLSESARTAGLWARVPTCPAWNVRQLVTHQGMVHRWAAANLRGERSHRTGASTREAVEAPDLLAWFEGGAQALRDTIEAAADDVVAPVFLLDAPPPRRFWARRQAHETTIHGVDALAARLGRWPSAADADVPAELAADGIDELLCGFLPRLKSPLRSVKPYRIAVQARDAGPAWTVSVSDAPPVTSSGVEAYDAGFSGTAAELYLGLWNRGTQMDLEGDPAVLEQWRAQVRVSWS